MITPEEIQQKAVRLYPQFVKAWLAGGDFFPKVIPSSKRRSGDIAADGDAIRSLRSGSKEVRGFGYSIEWQTRKLKNAGRNEVPERISIETQDDLLQLADRKVEFAALTTAVEQLRAAFPQLEDWICSNTKLLTGVSAQVGDLIKVTEWFQQNPNPNCFAREIPLAVHGKFIEQNQKLLQQWFDVEGILASTAIRSDETDFYRRYGLLDWEPMITIRCLDSAIQQQMNLPCSEASLPLSYLNSVKLKEPQIFVVENLTNLRTFPAIPNGLVIFGMGNAAVKLRFLKVLATSKVVYWGDLDTYGLRILSQYRQQVGEAESLLMDVGTLRRFRGLMTPPRKDYKPMALPTHLTQFEAEAFHECNRLNLQLEQERVPQKEVLELLKSIGKSVSQR